MKGRDPDKDSGLALVRRSGREHMEGGTAPTGLRAADPNILAFKRC